MLNRTWGKVNKVNKTTVHIQELEVEIEGELISAVNYRQLSRDVSPGDLVELNTTAVDLDLGTGGVHFVISSIPQQRVKEPLKAKHSPKLNGHIMKLRYTPLQLATLSVEEEKSPYHSTLQEADSLAGMPVMVASLHSLIAPIAVVFNHFAPGPTRLAYLMTDGAALPLAFSKLTASLKEKGLITMAITVGHAFGGDLEAVNIYSGLLAAKHAAKADACVVAMGPGVVGTGTLFGTTALETAPILDAVNSLGGRAIAVPRISLADKRPRHYGLSHHTCTVLMRLCHTACHLPLPQLGGDEGMHLQQQIEELGLDRRHHIYWIQEDRTLELLEEYQVEVTSMGRRPSDDPAFFRAGGAAGWLAARWLLDKNK
ncbi:MAG: DUF3866 family protein [Firmicutes bacterium]|nr:DUF3866 family protein [Bacillota bacterium]